MCSRASSAPPPPVPGRCCGSPRTSAPPPSGGSGPRPAATTTANALADQLEDSFTPGLLNLADRGFFSMHRWIRFSGTGAHLAWRIKNSARSVPLKTLRTLPDGSELVMLRESDGMRTGAGGTGDPRAERLPDTAARLVTFTVTTVTRSGRTKTTVMRVLTTLLDHEAYPARDIAVLYAERWQIEIAFLHLKRPVRGPRRPLRGQSPDLARQEAWALLLIHNITATGPAGRGIRRARPRPHPVHRRPRPCPVPRRRGHLLPGAAHRPASADDALASLNTAILALPRHRPGRRGHPAGPPPNDEPGTPKKSLTPSTSQSRISLNGTQHRKLKGSGVPGQHLTESRAHPVPKAPGPVVCL